MSEIETEPDDFNIKLNEYFKLKSTYESTINVHKKKLINNTLLSSKEKRKEFLKLKPKCINCKRPGGTLFLHQVENESRFVTALCNVRENPCNLDIKIDVGNNMLLPSILTDLESEISEIKNKIINYKNQQLFNFISSENAISQFDKLRTELNDTLSVFESYTNELNNILDNKVLYGEIKTKFESLQVFILQLKNAVVKFNETNNVEFIHDAVKIYINNILPDNKKLRELTYKDNMVWFNNQENTYHLIQQKNSFKDIEINLGQHKVVSFVIGNAKFDKNIIIEKEEVDKVTIPFSIKNKVIKWNDPLYEQLWETLGQKMKDALLIDPAWMKLFMKNCLKQRKNKEPCKFINPVDLIIPPEKETTNGIIEYNLGNEVYNKSFNALTTTHKATLLTLFSTKNGVKNYDLFKDAIANLLEKDLEFKNRPIIKY